MTKSELQELYWTKKNIQHMEDKLEELDTQATKITTQISDMPKGGSSHDKTGDVISKIVELKDEINYKLKMMYSLEKKVEKAIKNLPAREAYLIRLRYIEMNSWEQICVAMNYSWRQIHYIHSEALKMLS